MLTMPQSSNDPDALCLSKREILDQFDVAINRLKKNPIGNVKFIAELKAVKLMVSFTDEAKFPYYWMEIMKIIDSIRTLNELRKDGKENPNIKLLAENAQKHVEATIMDIPKPREKVKFSIAEALRYGGMKDA